MSGMENQLLEINPVLALFENTISALVVIIHENERPLLGLAGQLDWSFHGIISKFLKNQVITGKTGELVYLPATKNDRLYRLFLLGAGITPEPGSRQPLRNELLIKLNQNLKAITLDKVGVSSSDFGNPTFSSFQKNLMGVSVCICP